MCFEMSIVITENKEIKTILFAGSYRMEISVNPNIPKILLKLGSEHITNRGLISC